MVKSGRNSFAEKWAVYSETGTVDVGGIEQRNPLGSPFVQEMQGEQL